METFYTIIGFDFVPFAETDTGWNARRGIRSYVALSAARTALKRAKLPACGSYRILETTILYDGTVTTGWVT